MAIFPTGDYWNFFRREKPFLTYGLGLTFFSSFGQTFFLSLFVPYLLVEFSLSSSDFGALYAAATLVGALLLPWAGRWMDRVPLPRYTLAVILLLAASAFLLASARHIPVLFLALVGLRLSGQSLAFQTAVTAIARQYEVARGKALSIATLGLPLGEASLPLAVLALVGTLGWRNGWIVIGAASLAGFAPIVLLLLARSGKRLDPRRPTPSHVAADTSSHFGDSVTDGGQVPSASTDRTRLGPGGPAGEEALPTREDHATQFPQTGRRQWQRREVLGDRRFWMILPAALMPPFWATGLFLYQTNLAVTRGWSLSLMASAFGAFALTRVICSFAAGGLVDRLTARRIFPWTVLPLAGALALLLITQVWAPFAFMAMLGVAVGFGGTVKGALWAELYGIRHLGAIKSMMAAFMVVSTAAAPIVIGAFIDSPRAVPILLIFGTGTAVAAFPIALHGLQAPLKLQDGD
jgi:MFS family permease